MRNSRQRYLLVTFIGLSILCLILGGCSSKKKLTSRSNKKLEKSDCTAVRKNTIDWSAINESLKIIPLDPSKPSSAKFTPEENGGWSYKTENAEVNTSKNQEQKKEVNYDSIHKFQLLELERKHQEELKAAAAAEKKSRESNSESSRWPTWIYFILVLGIIIAAGKLVSKL